MFIRRFAYPVRVRVFAWVLIGLALWVAASVASLVSVRDDLDAAERALPSADFDVTDRDSLNEFASGLDSASERSGSAARTLESWHLRLWGPVPVVGRQIRAVGDMASSVSSVLEPVASLADEARRLPERRSMAERIDALERIGELADEANRRSIGADLGPTDGLHTLVADARVRVETELGEVADETERVRDAADGLASMLRGGTYVLLGANNAEMQLGSGMPLSVGVVTIDQGEFSVDAFGPSEDRFPVIGAEIVDPDLADRWGFLSPANDYRKLALTARFDDVVGPQTLEMFRADDGRRLDGVIALDAVVLAGVLDVVGGIEVDGVQLDSSTALPYLLEEQYVEFDGVDRTLRRDRLSVIASAVTERLSEGDWDPLDLVGALAEHAVAGRVRLYSVDATQQSAWRVLGVDGSVDAASTGVFLLNLGASKLDPFVSLSVDVAKPGDRQLIYEITVSNRSPAGLPGYATGPWDQLGLAGPGDYLGRLAIYVPAGTASVRFEPDRTLEVFGPDGEVGLIVTRLELARGEERRLRVALDLDRSYDSLTIVPSARVPEQRWTLDGADYLEGGDLVLRRP